MSDLQTFNKDQETAKNIMVEPTKAPGVAGAYSYEVAEQKCTETVTIADVIISVRSYYRRVPMKKKLASKG